LYFLPFGLKSGWALFRDGGRCCLLPFALIMGFGASFAGALADRFGRDCR